MLVTEIKARIVARCTLLQLLLRKTVIKTVFLLTAEIFAVKDCDKTDIADRGDDF